MHWLQIKRLLQHQNKKKQQEIKGIISTVQPQPEVLLPYTCQLCTYGVKKAGYHHNLSDYFYSKNRPTGRQYARVLLFHPDPDQRLNHIPTIGQARSFKK